MLPYLFLILGLVCIFLEFFLPGGILGGFGGVLCFVGLGVSIAKAQSFMDVVIFALVGAAATVLIIWLALKRLKNSKSQSEMYHNQDQEGFKASNYPKELVGLEGETLTTCNPSGYIRVDGGRYQAVSQGSFIEKNQKVKIIDGRGAYLVIVKL